MKYSGLYFYYLENSLRKERLYRALFCNRVNYTIKSNSLIKKVYINLWYSATLTPSGKTKNVKNITNGSISSRRNKNSAMQCLIKTWRRSVGRIEQRKVALLISAVITFCEIIKSINR